MISYLESDCEGIDAAVFSGDVLYDPAQRKLLQEYVARWEKALEGEKAPTEKQFMYFESIEGGMVSYAVSTGRDLSGLYGWMSKGCEADDQGLLNWMESANVGEFYEHRLGTLVRLKDV